MRNILVVLSGPSGVGKGTVAKLICERNSKMCLSISATTRKPRTNEVDGREYFFVSKEQFSNKVKENGFLEYSEHFQNYYGTPKEYVIDKLNDYDVMLEIDVNGGLNVKQNYPNAVLIMIMPPSIEEIKNRLIKRNTETLEKIELRMQRIGYELEKQDQYDYKVVNDDLMKTVEQIEKIISNEKNKQTV